MQTTTTHLAARLARPLADVHVRRALALALLPFGLALIGALASVWPSASQATPATAQPIIIITATPAAPTSGPETAAYQPPRAILARWDYRDPASAVAITSADVARAIGWAGDWRFVLTTAGAQVWIAAIDLPPDTPADSPLADLAPKPTPIIVFVEVPAPVPTAQIEAGGVRIQTTTAPECWAGPPAVWQPGQERCWNGVPFVQP